jgi:type VI secretion system secreted protein VgrG
VNNLELSGSPSLSFEVRHFHFAEMLGGLYQLHATIHTRMHDVAMADVVGREAFMPLTNQPSMSGIGGIVRQVRLMSTELSGESVFELTVVPPHWLCTRSTNNRIFQRRTVAQIVADVLEGYGTVGEPRERLTGDYPQREYCTQYGETDWAFIQRILAHEGITSYFEHGREPLWVLTDATDAQTPERREVLPFRPHMGSGGGTSGLAVFDARMTAKVKSAQATYRDYDFEHPLFAVEGTSETPEEELFRSEANLELYRFGSDEARTGGEAESLAARTRQSARTPGRRFDLVTDAAVPCGARLTLSEHPRDDLNTAMLVLKSTITADLHGGLRAHLECIRADERFRPRRRPRPRVMGTQTAKVVAEQEGPEIDVDSHARVLLKFHWDRRDKRHDTSRRVRVSQAWAGPQYGLVCLPRVGDEVIVDFLDGDPDAPIVVGRVHNATNPIPLQLPGENMISIWRSRSTPGGNGHNHILLDDRAGSERVEVRAQHDYRREVLHNSSTTIGANRTMQVSGNTTSSIGGHHRERVRRSKELNVGDDHTIQVGGDELKTIAGKQEIKINGERLMVVKEDSEYRHDGNRTVRVEGVRLAAVKESDTVRAGTYLTREGRRAVVLVSERLITLAIDSGPIGTAPMVQLRSEGNEIDARAANIFVGATAGIVLNSENRVNVTATTTVDVCAEGGVTINGATVNIN